jgi:hypothetical protein
MELEYQIRQSDDEECAPILRELLSWWCSTGWLVAYCMLVIVNYFLWSPNIEEDVCVVVVVVVVVFQ